jgi:putative ABC transport system ATP-binding protein
MEIIKAQNIEKAFKSGTLETKVLKGVSLSVKEGEFLSIMGRSGAGKSTLLYQLSLLDKPTAGSINILGQEVVGMSEEDKTLFRLNTLGYIFQDYALVLELSAIDNVLIPLLARGEDKDESLKRAETALTKVGLAGKEKNLPSQLSGGEQQRVSIARAIVGNPKIIFADEPTANLDRVSSEQVLGVLEDLHKNGLTIVMVTHEPEYAERTNRTIYLDDGQIIGEKER